LIFQDVTLRIDFVGDGADRLFVFPQIVWSKNQDES